MAFVRAVYPYLLRIRAGDAYPKCDMRNRGEVISILSDISCENTSGPYQRYESQETGIYPMLNLVAPAESSVKRSPPLFSRADNRGIHVQALKSDKRRSRPTRKERFNLATGPVRVVIRL